MSNFSFLDTQSDLISNEITNAGVWHDVCDADVLSPKSLFLWEYNQEHAHQPCSFRPPYFLI